MAGYVEGDRSADDLIAAGFDADAVERVVGLVDRAEYKRRQMPPGVRISGKAFGKDRRMPITNHYRPSVAPGARQVDQAAGSGTGAALSGRSERGGPGGCLTSRVPSTEEPNRSVPGRRACPR